MVQELGEKELYKKGSLKKDFKPKPSRQIIGQERALNALNFAVNLSAPNAHVVCLGPKGVGRTSLTLDILNQFAENRPAPLDWVYVADFNDFLHPTPICLPAGTGGIFAEKTERMTEKIQEGLKALFSGENYQIQLAHIKQRHAAEKQADFNRLAKSVATPFTQLSKTQNGIVISPVKDGQILTPQMFNDLALE